MKVAIVGAGAAGLAAARVLIQRGHESFTVFESTSHVGGTWFHNKNFENRIDGLTVHGSMYDNLRTNLPKEAMAFPDFPFKSKGKSSFPSHKEVLEYLKSFMSFHAICKYIQFNTHVDKIYPCMPEKQSNRTTWMLETVKIGHNNCKHSFNKEEFDSIIVCNGHFSIPSTPEIPGCDKFRGKILHSSEYRNPKVFCNKRVVLLGAGPSAVDMAIDLTSEADHVVLSHRRLNSMNNLPRKIEQKPSIKQFTQDSVIFSDDSELCCDAVMFCTGYQYHFPFFKTPNIINIQNGRITPLYKHLVSINYPTLFFIGLCHRILPFPHFHKQACFVHGVLNGSVTLPPQDIMLKDEESDYLKHKSEGLADKYSHVLGPMQWQYNQELAEMCGESSVSEVPQILYDHCWQQRNKDLVAFRKVDYSDIADKLNKEDLLKLLNSDGNKFGEYL